MSADQLRDAAARLGDVDRARLANAVGLTVLVVVVVPFLLFAVPQLAGADASYVVLSGSMQPAMAPGDVILVESVDPSAIEAGDVITYGRASEAAPTTHRVVEVVDRNGEVAFRTKGDANEDADIGIVPASAVIGRVLTIGGVLVVIPAIGYVIEFAGTQLGFALLVLVPLALLAASDAWYIVASTRRPRDDKPAYWDVDGEAAARAAPVDEPADAARRRGEAVRTVEPATDDEEAVTISPNELRLGLAVLVPFAAYSLWVAVDDPNPWTISVAAAVWAAGLLLGGLYLFGGTEVAEPGDGAAVGGPETTDHRPSGQPRRAGRPAEGGSTDD